jgi:hypothetical protein
MQDIGRCVPGGDNTMQAANDVAKHMIQERREGFGGPCYAGARPRSKAWPIDRHRVELWGEPFHEWTHFATRGNRAQGRKQENERTTPRLIEAEHDVLPLP